jgi:lipopolysaccharide transport system permease protein
MPDHVLPNPVASASRETVIRPARGVFHLDFGELWAYRELWAFLIWRDIKVRYKQTAIGGAWALLQPLTAMLIFTVVFGRFAKIPSNGVAYPVFVYAGLLPWQYFASSLTGSSTSLVGSSNLITKVYFPRLLIPFSAVAVPIIDFLLAMTILIGLMIYYSITPTINVVVLPVFLLLALGTALGAGLWLSALNVRYRDIPFVLPFLMQIWMYASPVVYPIQLVPEKWQWAFALNPMTGVIEGFRWALLGQKAPSMTVLALSAAVAVVFAITGIIYFRRSERRFADII